MPARPTKIPGTIATRFTPENAEKFLIVLRDGWPVTKAARSINIPRETAYAWRKQHTEFADAWDAAIVEGSEHIEAEAIRRAVEGYDEAVYHQGEVVGFRTHFSDNLLSQQLEARMPDKYRKNLNVSGTLPASQTNILLIAGSTAPLDAFRMYKNLIGGNGEET